MFTTVHESLTTANGLAVFVRVAGMKFGSKSFSSHFVKFLF